MGVDCYNGIAESEIKASRKTKQGTEFTLNHPDGLLVDMKYKGQEKSTSNAQGWERSKQYYFKELLEKHPEYFSRYNKARIKNGESPKVDDVFVKHFPEYEKYKGEQMIHHHIGGDGQAVAVPRSIHRGSGGIHVDERKLGITANAKEYSSLCADITKNHPEMEGKTSKEFRQYIKDNKIIAKEGQGVTSKPYEPISDKNSRANDKRIRPQIQAREQHAKQTLNMRRGRTIS